jgi:hypothetical protein
LYTNTKVKNKDNKDTGKLGWQYNFL